MLGSEVGAATSRSSGILLVPTAVGFGRKGVTMPVGRVKWFNDEKGFGFLEQDNGQDVFVHHTAVKMDGFRSLAEGQEVEFELEQSDRGPRATDVRVI
jgi:CspA family cold shock protein